MKSTLVADAKVITDAAAVAVATLSPWAKATPAGTNEKAVKDAHDAMTTAHTAYKTAADKLTASAKA